eukprot:359739-Chlamydomonas_euryale.AAC.2
MAQGCNHECTTVHATLQGGQDGGGDKAGKCNAALKPKCVFNRGGQDEQGGHDWRLQGGPAVKVCIQQRRAGRGGNKTGKCRGVL